MNTKLLIFSALALGLIPLTAAVNADNAMSGMDMSGAKPTQKPNAASLSVTATINPAAPKSGDNTLDLMVMDAAGKPVTGLKLTSSVAMTSMDMGTTHPAFTEAGGGHYKATVSFSMEGPWRVVAKNQSASVAALDFQAGSKTPWKSPQIKAVPGTPSAAPKPAAKVPAAGAMVGMDMGIADMKTATIPELKEKGTYVATGTEDWKKQAGFGHNAPMVGMMNQMMVGGSGMEGMKMAPMTMKFDEKNYAKPEGDEAASADNMAGMDMSGKNKGMKMDAPAPASPGPAVPASVPVAVAAAINAPKSGDNALQITVTDAQGKPVAGAKITTSVAMTSMDMGTTHPAVKDVGNGKYAATVNFSMAGPWRVNVKVTPPGQKPQVKAFDFTAK